MSIGWTRWYESAIVNNESSQNKKFSDDNNRSQLSDQLGTDKEADIMKSFEELFVEFLKFLIEKFEGKNKSTFKGEFMYIVKDDNPAVGFSVSYDAFDSEGNAVPEDSLVVEVVSDNEDAVSIDFDKSAGTGMATFGSPGLANINATVSDANGNLLGSFGAQFTVTVGDPASISGGTLSFDGLQEAVEPTPAPEPAPEPAPAPADNTGTTGTDVPTDQPVDGSGGTGSGEEPTF